MKLKDIRDMAGVQFTDDSGLTFMTLRLCAGMCGNSTPVGSEDKAPVVVIARQRGSQWHPGTTHYLMLDTEITLVPDGR